MRCFVYTPRSGSKLFAQGWFPDGLGVTDLPNASHHIECIAEVSTFTASPGYYFRQEAIRWISLLVNEAGGAAADEGGDVVYYAPTPEAADAARRILLLIVKQANDHRAIDRRQTTMVDRAEEARLRMEINLAAIALLPSGDFGWDRCETAFVCARNAKQAMINTAVVTACEEARS